MNINKEYYIHRQSTLWQNTLLTDFWNQESEILSKEGGVNISAEKQRMSGAPGKLCQQLACCCFLAPQEWGAPKVLGKSFGRRKPTPTLKPDVVVASRGVG